jgi:hypothetical protein
MEGLVFGNKSKFRFSPCRSQAAKLASLAEANRGFRVDCDWRGQTMVQTIRIPELHVEPSTKENKVLLQNQ